MILSSHIIMRSLSIRDFAAIKKQRGILGVGAFLRVKTIKNRTNESRFGAVVSSRVSKKAVERNKIKRRLRAIIRGKEFIIKNGLDIVVIVLPSVMGVSYNELKSDFFQVLKRLNVLTREND